MSSETDSVSILEITGEIKSESVGSISEISVTVTQAVVLFFGLPKFTLFGGISNNEGISNTQSQCF